MRNPKALIVLLIILVASVANAYDNDPNDFATEVIGYVQGVGVGTDFISGQPFNDPARALGCPTTDTTDDAWYIPPGQIVPVVPIYPAFRSFELVTVGEGGNLIVKFGHPVADDKNNRYGIDFIVFGNARYHRQGGGGWTNGDPSLSSLGSGDLEPATISVSQDGVKWYSFTNDQEFMAGDPNFVVFPPGADDGPFGDDFAPTLGRVYDIENPDTSIGDWNLWWGQPTNPTLPLDPNLTVADYTGDTVAQIAQDYGESAGGTGFDINLLDLPRDENGLKWFQYVRVDNLSASGRTPDIDAFSDVAACGDYKHPFPRGDINEDCVVDFLDFVMLASNWLKCTWACP